MSRKNYKGRRIYPKYFSKIRIAKILGIKPRLLTKKNGYVSTVINYEKYVPKNTN
jgi:hypothetical protein